MKVGLPRALLYYYYNPLWQAFFRHLRVETVDSGPTTKEIMDAGVRCSVAEICVPFKIFCGHAAALLDRGDVNYIFVPRMISVEKHKHFCPKFLGLPDMIRHLLPLCEGRLLAPDVRCKRESIEDFDDLYSLAGPLGVSTAEIRRALRAARTEWEAFRHRNVQGLTAEEAIVCMNGGPLPDSPAAAARVCAGQTSAPAGAPRSLTIGLLGYVYNIYDSFVGMDIVAKLRSMGAEVVTFEMLDDRPIVDKLRPLNKSLPWTFSNKLLGAGYSFFEDPRIDGLLHVTAFGCGPDSILGRMLEFASHDTSKPFMTIRVDEHTGEAHLATRVEAFIDMLKRQKLSL